ncbi:MAG: putative RNA uridine N3 methyltransferase, partial [Nitrososphaerales archaeon]
APSPPDGNARAFCIKVQKSTKVLVLFGSPKLGLPAMMEKEGLDQKSGMMINTISRQGVATVRTEEAMAASLSLVNVACNLKISN